MAIDATKTRLKEITSIEALEKAIVDTQDKAKAEGLRYIAPGEGEVPFADGVHKLKIVGLQNRNRYGTNDNGPYLIQDILVECVFNGSKKTFPAPIGEGKQLLASINRTIEITVAREKADNGRIYPRITGFSYAIKAAKEKAAEEVAAEMSEDI